MKKIIFVLALFAVFGYLASVAQADVWQAPPANPPNSNRPAPIDQSALSQTKAGALTVQGGLTAGGGGQFQVTSVGVLNMGTTANFQLINVAAGLDATNVMQGNAVYGHSSGHGLYGESSGNAYAGVYGINTGTGWAGYFQGPTGLSSYLVVGGAAQAGYSGVGDAYFYDDVGLAGDLIVSGTVRGNFVDQNGLACAQGQILKKDVVGLWTCQDDSGSLWTDMPGAGETRYMYANEAGAIKIYGNDSENTGFPNRLVIGDGTNEALDQLCLQGIAGGQCISNWADVQGTSYWIDAGAYIRPAATANFQITESNGELQVINANVVINGGHLDLENYGLIRYSSENQTPPVLIADQLMVGRKYCDAAGAFCDPPAQELGVDLANNENLIFGRVRANPTGNTNQNLLRLQQGDGDDVTIDMFKVDLQGDVYARGNVGIGATNPGAKLEVNGMAMFGSSALNLSAGQNLIYGNIDSASQGNLVVLQNESVNQFAVLADGTVNLNGNIYFYKGGAANREIAVQTQTTQAPGINLKIYAGSANQSFAGETKINTPLGLVKIKDLRIGDKVLSYNPDSKKHTEAVVRKIFSHQAESYYRLNGYLKATAKHPFYTQDGWKKVKDLSLSDQLFTIQGWQKLDSKKLINEKLFVYNLQVDQPNTYFAEGVLVHNKAPVDGGDLYLYGGQPAGVGEGSAGDVILANTGSGVRGKVIIGDQQAWPQANVLEVYGSTYIGAINADLISTQSYIDVGGTVLMGYQRVSQNCGTVSQCGVSCPEGTKVLSGGCDTSGYLRDSYPEGDDRTWSCRTSSSVSITAYAICARIGN